MSAPAAKARSPAPVMTIARHDSSSSSTASTSSRSASSANDSAFRASPVERDEGDAIARGFPRGERHADEGSLAVVGHRVASLSQSVSV